jgi:hypothetical protein
MTARIPRSAGRLHTASVCEEIERVYYRMQLDLVELAKHILQSPA